MCTVTFLPIDDGCILSSNRDESPHRSPKNLTRLSGVNFNLVFPQDTLAGGTWIAADDRKRVTCILNGAFQKHKHMPPYRMSRGLIALDYFNYDSLEDFLNVFEFNGIEPFTMVVIEFDRLYEIRWDGELLHRTALDSEKTHIWSSCTLYDEEVQRQRVEWFEKWKENVTDYGLEQIQQFHNFSDGQDMENGIVMNRNNIVRTVSVTNVELAGSEVSVHYQELVRSLNNVVKMKLRPSLVE